MPPLAFTGLFQVDNRAKFD